MKFVQGDVFEVDLPRRGFALVYADPPYAGCRFKYARRNGSRQWGRNARADFMRELIARMEWLRAPEGMAAMSMTSNEALRLGYLFPTNARQLAWTKPYAPMRPHVYPRYAWEPVVVWGKFCGRVEQRVSKTPHDWLNLSPRVPRDGGHETPKPAGFAEWVINQTLGPRRGSMVDLFSGSMAVANAAEAHGCIVTAVDLDDYRPPLLRDERPDPEKCCVGAWEESGGGARKCSDCGKWLREATA